MNRLRLSGIFIFLLLVLLGCSDATPTRFNDFTPLTSMEITAVPASIAKKTSARLTVIGNFSGLFTRDITSQVVFSSSTPDIADFKTPSVPSRVSGIAAGTALIIATRGTVTATCRLTVSDATVTALNMLPADPSVPKGLSQQFTVSGTFSDSSTQDLTFDAVWTSSDATRASVSNDAASKGLAQALATGTATISAVFDSDKSASTPLTVTDPILRSVTVSSSAASVVSLSSASFSASGRYSDDSVKDVTSLASWSSSQADIASIAAGGVATTLLPGTTTVSASLDGVSGSAPLKVTGGSLTGIEVTRGSLKGTTVTVANAGMVKGNIARIWATGTFSNKTQRDITGSVTWTSSDPALATVSTPGGKLAWVTAVEATPAAFPVKITATSNGKSASTDIAIGNPTLTALAVTPATVTLAAGTGARLTVHGTYSDNITRELTYNAAWTSAVADRVSVGDLGVQKGRVLGKSSNAAAVSITAALGGLSSSAAITVAEKTLKSLILSAPPAGFVAGTQASLSVTANYSDNTSRDVSEDASWSISSPAVAVMADGDNLPGSVVAVDSGTATLTVTFGGLTQTITIVVP